MTVVSRNETKTNLQKISNSRDCANAFFAIWDKTKLLKHERVYILYLNSKNEIIETNLLNIGSFSETNFDLRGAVEFALVNNASGIVFAHNHPSGNCTPSVMDINITAKIKSVLSILEINLIDHLIITPGDYFSFTDNKTLIN